MIILATGKARRFFVPKIKHSKAMKLEAFSLTEKQPTTTQDRAEQLAAAGTIFSRMREQQSKRHAREREEYNDAENIAFIIRERKDALMSLRALLWNLREECGDVMPALIYHYFNAHETPLVRTKINELFDIMDLLNKTAMYKETFDRLCEEYIESEKLIDTLSFSDYKKFGTEQQ